MFMTSSRFQLELLGVFISDSGSMFIIKMHLLLYRQKKKLWKYSVSVSVCVRESGGEQFLHINDVVIVLF